MAQPELSGRLPEWDGYAREAGEVWTLRKGSRVAACHLWTHPYGGEARCTVDGELVQSQAGRDVLALVDQALAWKERFTGERG
jgi:hypothetical protein